MITTSDFMKTNPIQTQNKPKQTQFQTRRTVFSKYQEDFKRHFKNTTPASAVPSANNGQEKWDWKCASVMCRPAMQKEITTATPARINASQSVKVTLNNRPQQQRYSITAANISSIAEIITGARTGAAQTIGIRNNTSQSIIDPGQSRSAFSQR